MKFLAGIGGFIFGLTFGAPFFGALILGLVAYAMVRLFTPERTEKPSRSTSPARPSDAAWVEPTRVEPTPDGTDPVRLRIYLRELNNRIQALERELKTLRGGAPAPTPQQQPIAEAAPVVFEAPPAPAPVVPAPELAKALEEVAKVAEALSVAPPPPAPKAQPALEPLPQIESAQRPVPAAAPRPASAVQRSPRVPPPPPPSAEKPRGPSWFQRMLTENLVAKVGALLLFIGVGFLLKFAYDRGLMPLEVRLVGVAAAAVALFVVARRLLATRRLYALILEGAASGLLYLDVYFALKRAAFGGLIGPAASFVAFALLGVATTVVAVRQDAKPFALLGLTGAFLAPILASTGGGDHVLLFSYYLLLNLFVLGVSWFKAWRSLNLMGWFFTFAVAVLWGADHYSPALFPTVEPFLLAFFVIYLVIPILFATRQPPELKGLVDGTLVFGTPAAVAALQARLVWDIPYGLAWSAALGAALYAVLSAVVFRQRNMRLLGQTYVALAVGLGTLAIFFACGAYTTFALWSIEGTAIVWVCLRQQQPLGRLFGFLVQLAGAAYFFLDYGGYSRVNPYFNDAVLGCAIITVAAFLSAGLMRRHQEAITAYEAIIVRCALVWGALWWSLGGIDLIHHGVARAHQAAALVLYFSAGAMIVEWIGRGTAWPMLRGLSAMHVLVLVAAALVQASASTHPLADLGWIAWPAGFGSLFWILYRQRVDDFDVARDARDYGGWLILGGIATWEAVHWLELHRSGYAMALALGACLAAGLRHRLREREPGSEERFSTLPLIWATALWYFAGIQWIRDALALADQPAAAILFVTASAVAVEVLGASLAWTALRSSGGVQPLFLVGAALVQLSLGTHPSAGYGWLAWPAGLGASLWILHRQRRDGFGSTRMLRYALAWLTLGAVATWEALWWAREREYVYTMALALAAYAVAGLRFHLREREAQNPPLSNAPLLWGMLFWYAGGLLWIRDILPHAQAPAGALLFLAASALATEFVGAALRWHGLRASGGVQILLLAGVALVQLAIPTHPGEGYGWLAWLAALGGLFWSLHRQRRDDFDALRSARYGAAWVLSALLATWEAGWWIDRHEYAYTLAIAAGGHVVAALRHRLSDHASGRPYMSTAALVWAMAFWFAAAFLWIHERMPDGQVQAGLLFAAASALVYEVAFRPLDWRALGMAARLPALVLPLAVLLELGVGRAGHPFSGWASIAWPAAWALVLYGLWREEGEERDAPQDLRHALAVYVPLVLFTWEIGWRLVDWDFGAGWRLAGLAVPAIVAVAALTAARGSAHWPFRAHGPRYVGMLGPVVVLLMAWSLIVNVRAPGSLAPLTVYLPLLNPIDTALVAAACAGAMWYGALESDAQRRLMRAAAAVLGFVWLNASALRAIHYWGAVPWEPRELASSVVVQSTLSILWTGTALALMLLARRRVQRQLWLLGAALLAVVVGKLFLVDLANTGTVERIVSFVGVGVMLLIIGYAAPVPPGAKEAERDT